MYIVFLRSSMYQLTNDYVFLISKFGTNKLASRRFPGIGKGVEFPLYSIFCFLDLRRIIEWLDFWVNSCMLVFMRGFAEGNVIL